MSDAQLAQDEASWQNEETTSPSLWGGTDLPSTNNGSGIWTPVAQEESEIPAKEATVPAIDLPNWSQRPSPSHRTNGSVKPASIGSIAELRGPTNIQSQSSSASIPRTQSISSTISSAPQTAATSLNATPVPPTRNLSRTSLVHTKDSPQRLQPAPFRLIQTHRSFLLALFGTVFCFWVLVWLLASLLASVGMTLLISDEALSAGHLLSRAGQQLALLVQSQLQGGESTFLYKVFSWLRVVLEWTASLIWQLMWTLLAIPNPLPLLQSVFWTLWQGVQSLVILLLHFHIPSTYHPVLLGVIAVLYLGWIAIRYGWQTRYARLKPLSPANEASSAAAAYLQHPAAVPEAPLRLAEEQVPQEEFLGAFLSSIKVFGHLEKPVFRELARHLVERKLAPGDLLFTQPQDRAFYVVVDGRIQVHVVGNGGGNIASLQSSSSNNEWDDSSFLLHEVQSGGTVSSLFNVLALFTEEIKPLSSPAISFEEKSGNLEMNELRLFPSLDADLGKTGPRRASSFRPNDILAKAVQESTVMVLPECAFHRIAALFPQSASHMIQVILTRLQRVTFLTHQYLGLTQELLQMERRVTEMGTVIVPDALLEVHQAMNTNDSMKKWIMQCMMKSMGSLDEFVIGNNNVQFQTSAGSSNSSLNSPSNAPSNVFSTAASSIEIMQLQRGAILLRQGERPQGIYFVLSGSLSAMTESSASSSFTISSGQLAAYLPTLTGHASLVTLRASASQTWIARLDKPHLDRLVDRQPMLLFTLAKRLVQQVTPLVRHMDFALEWIQFSAGQIICRQGEESDSLFLVLNGRLRAVMNEESNWVEYGQGQSVGELQMLTDAPRPATLFAIRDTELVRVPKRLFHALAMRYPAMSMQISRMIAQTSSSATPSNSNASGTQRTLTNFKTIAIVGLNEKVPLQRFASLLYSSILLEQVSCRLLDNASVAQALGKHAFTSLGALKLQHWLAEQEATHQLVLLLAADRNSAWTRRCIRQADCLLLVALADEVLPLSSLEQWMVQSTSARKELILLHRERACPSGLALSWLRVRPWLSAHHHIQMPGVALSKSTSTAPLNKPRHIVTSQSALWWWMKQEHHLLPNVPSHHADMARLARHLTGKSIGVVLGGGGARGIAHVGVLRALEESGIPIDMIGGTSIGAFVGALFARQSDPVSCYGRVKNFAMRMQSKWRQLLDLTYPTTAWFTGHAFNRAIWKSFGDVQAEDLWLPWYAITTSITHSRMQVHQHGYVWRYVRASMSLSGFLPPLCDQGNLLLDGGYIDILPAATMRSLGVQTILAVDVSNEDDNQPVHYGESVSGWMLLFMRCLGRQTRVPTLEQIQSRLAFVSSVQRLEQVKKMPGCLYLKPDVSHFGVMEFGSFQAIYESGYAYGKKLVAEWIQQGDRHPLHLYLRAKEKVSRQGVDNLHGRRASI